MKCKVCKKDFDRWIEPINHKNVPTDLKIERELCCSYNCFKKIHPLLCKGCGKKRYHSSNYGYCSSRCLLKYDSKLYYAKRPLNNNERPKEKFKKHGLLYEPLTEDEVLFLFAKLHKKLGFKYVKIARQTFPDCIAVNDKGVTVRIEFEYTSKRYNHDITGCDYIVCWIHDWIDCPIKVISLKEFIGTNKRTHKKTLFDY